MQCIEIRKRLDAWVDGELPPPEAERIAHHLDGCPACRLDADGIRQIAAALDALPVLAAPAALSSRTLRAFRAGVEKPGLSEWWRELSLVMRSAVCGAALAGLLCGAVLGTSLVTRGTDAAVNPYQTLYASKGIYP